VPFFLIEAVLPAVYRDCFVLDVLMPVRPIEVFKTWQTGRRS
jgi:hypothetical protein